MNIKRLGSVAAVAVTGGLLLSSCAVNEMGLPSGDSGVSGTLIGAGSSAQQSAQEAWVAAFQTANPDATVEYDPVGSGGGRDTFAGGGSTFAGSDRAFDDEEVDTLSFASCAPDTGIIEIPAYISPIAVIFNLDGIERLNMDAETLAGIFAGEITNWNDERIASQNEGIELPDLAITAVHRADDSGTTENFTDYLAGAAPEVWTYEPDGEWPFQGGEAAPQTSGVVDAVANGTGTVGYADASRSADFGVVAVKVGDEYIEYSPEAAAAVVDASPRVEGRGEGDIAVEIDRATEEAGVYPVVLLSYLIACVEYRDVGQAELVRAYFDYIVSEEGQQAAADAAGSAPISDALFDEASAAIDLIQ